MFAEVLRPNKTQRRRGLENMEVQWTTKTWRYKLQWTAKMLRCNVVS